MFSDSIAQSKIEPNIKAQTLTMITEYHMSSDQNSFENQILSTYIGHRAKIGVIIPSTNTAVEYDLQKVLPRGVTWHPSRFWVESPDLSSDNSFLHFLDLIRKDIPISIRNVLDCKPDHIMMGMSAETFWGGVEGNKDFIEKVREQIGDLGLTTGANAMNDALRLMNAKKIAVLTPYQPIGDQNVQLYFSECGYEVKKVIGLKCPTATSIAEVPIPDVVEAVKELHKEDVDAIIQVGTNLSTMDIFPTLERYLNTPCIPINVTTMWHALRANGIKDQFDGLGQLFEKY